MVVVGWDVHHVSTTHALHLAVKHKHAFAVNECPNFTAVMVYLVAYVLAFL